MADSDLVEDQECLGHACGPHECFQNGDTSGVFTTEAWYGPPAVARWAGEDKDWVQELTMPTPKKDEMIADLSKMTR